MLLGHSSLFGGQIGDESKLEVRHPIWEFAMTNRASNSGRDCPPRAQHDRLRATEPCEGILRDRNGRR